MQYFKNTMFEYPGTIKPGQGNVKVEWLFQDLKKDMIDVDKSGKPIITKQCGCTADIEVLEDRIVALYNNSTNGSNAPQEIEKYIKVYLKDDLPAFTENSRGVNAPTEGKQIIQLDFKVKVLK